jgi:excisionase family DNA binding protein
MPRRSRTEFPAAYSVTAAVSYGAIPPAPAPRIPAKPDDRRALTVPQFSRRYGPSISKTYEMLKTGELHSVKIGGRRLIPVDAAEALLKPGLRLAGGRP